METTRNRRDAFQKGAENGRGRAMLSAAIVAVLTISLAAGSVLAAKGDEQGPSPVDGNGLVVAQGLSVMPDKNLVWSVTEREADPTEKAKPETSSLGFVVANEYPLLVLEKADRGARLAGGEAAITYKGDKPTISTFEDDAVPYISIELLDATAKSVKNIYTSDDFKAPTGLRDLDLVSDTLEEDDSIDVDSTDAPILVYVASGVIEIEIDGDSDDIKTLEEGEALAIEDDFSIENVEQDDAVIYIAIIGPEIPSEDSGSKTTTITVKTPGADTAKTPGANPTPTKTTTAGNSDTDGDGLSDSDEAQIGTDPNNEDTDADGLTDGTEIQVGTDPLEADMDGDGLTDGDEVLLVGSSPLEEDTDGDGIFDGDEVNVFGSDPTTPDTDNDDLDDFDEIINFQTNPNNPDSDNDALRDVEELNVFGTDPNSADTDGDGILDGDEVNGGNGFVTDPAVSDSDGDGIDDGTEGFATNGFSTDPNNPDTDGDGFSDSEEINGGFSPLDDQDHP